MTSSGMMANSASQPRVSIFVPVYNGETYLEQMMESLLAQSFEEFEIIIVNDGSTDGTLGISRRYAARDKRVHVVSHKKNKGLSAARNTGWQSASPTSRYIMNHDSDDLSHRDKLKRLVGYLDRNNEIVAAGSFCDYIDESGRAFGWPPLEWRPRWIRASFGRVNSMVISATLIQRTLFDTIGGFRAEFGGCDDYDFWARALLHGFELANIPEVLHSIRIHRGSMGATRTAEMETKAAIIREDYNRQSRGTVLSALVAASLGKTLRFRSAMRRKLHAPVPAGTGQ